MSNKLYAVYAIPLLVFLILMLLLLPPFSCCLEEIIVCPIYRYFTIGIIVTAFAFLGAALVIYHFDTN